MELHLTSNEEVIVHIALKRELEHFNNGIEKTNGDETIMGFRNDLQSAINKIEAAVEGQHDA